jgi:hypothetical protein
MGSTTSGKFLEKCFPDEWIFNIPDHDPNNVYHEPAPLNRDSVGLLQLSYSDQKMYEVEHLDPALESLKDPFVNIRCGVTILAHWMAKDEALRGRI